MCGPSQAMKNLNNTVQGFTKQVVSEAGTVFGAANTVFNNILNSAQSIVNGGPSQAGFSAEENNAYTASNVQASGTMARNLKAAAASSGAAIGGGNTVAPSGSVQAAVENAETTAAATEATNQNQILQANYQTGRQNFFQALGAEEQAPSVFATSTAANKEAGDQLTAAQTSQQNIDTQNNWWKNDLMKVGMTVASTAAKAYTGGLLGGGSVGDSMGGGYEGADAVSAPTAS